MGINVRFLSIILVGFAFMFTFMAFQTMGSIEKTILDSVTKSDKNFKGDGYKSLCVIYAFFSLCNWIAPPIIYLIGPRICMIIGAVTYMLFILSFLKPITWLLYLASAVLGFGAALIWTAQGNYMTLNSTDETITRNAGIFWSMLQCSFLFGNLFVFIQFKGQSTIEDDLRRTVVYVLSAFSLVGLIIFCLLPRPPKKRGIDAEEMPVPDTKEKPPSPLQVIKGAGKLFITPNMLLLSVAFFYSGLELGFFSGIYSNSVGFTKMFSSRKELVGLSGIFIGLGEVMAGSVFGILGSKTTRWGKNPIIVGGFIFHIIAFATITLNLPNKSPLGETDDKAILKNSSPVLAMAGSFLLGLGDAMFNTQFYSTLGSVYADKSAEAFSIFKFTQSVAAACSFLYAAYVPLYGLMGLLVVMAVLGTSCFFAAERRTIKMQKQAEGQP